MINTGRHSEASIWACQRLAQRLGPTPAVVRVQLHAEELAQFAIEVVQAGLRPTEHAELDIAQSRQPLGEYAQRHRLAQPREPGDQGEAALAHELLDAPAERIQARPDVERLDRDLGGKRIPLQSIQREQFLVHDCSDGSSLGR